MTRKAEPPSRRSPRRRSPAAPQSEPPRRKAKPTQIDPGYDSDFGVALAVVPALKRRPDA
jgi:hypothetical protein